MIDGGKIAVDVAAQHMRVAVAVMLVGGDGPVRALARAVGVGVADETRLENRRHHAAKRVMHDAVAERRRRNDALFRLAHQDFHIAARLVGSRLQLAFEPQQLAL